MMQCRLWGVLFYLIVVGCNSKQKNQAPLARKVDKDYVLKTRQTKEKKSLSDYGFFKGPLAELMPSTGVFPYQVNTPLFSDYADKARFIYLPEQIKMDFKAQGPFSFGEGAILIKNFFYPYNKAKPDKGRRIIETRLLIREKAAWKPLNYLWNEAQTDATLDYVGKTTEVLWKDLRGKEKKVNYVVPNNNQCKNCHSTNNQIIPIGITAAQLNQRYFASKHAINQLDYFKAQNVLTNFSRAKDYSPLPIWDDTKTGTLDQRARAYLDANCAHCHSAQGSAKNSGLYLNYHEKDPRKRGVLKPPIAAGKGSGNFQYDIVPGQPHESIFIYRMKSTDPAIRMPEIGRSLVHKEGVALLASYIEELANK